MSEKRYRNPNVRRYVVSFTRDADGFINSHTLNCGHALPPTFRKVKPPVTMHCSECGPGAGMLRVQDWPVNARVTCRLCGLLLSEGWRTESAGNSIPIRRVECLACMEVALA